MNMSIALDTNTYQRYAYYAKTVGKPIDQVVTKALNRWMDDFGDIILKSYEELVAQQAKKARTKKKKKLAPVIAFAPQITAEKIALQSSS